jgi:hypothetical protein
MIEMLDDIEGLESTDLELDIDSKLNELFNEAETVKSDVNLIQYNENTNKLQSEISEYVLKLKRSDIEEEKELNKFIKKCETMIRMCPEYNDWTTYIRDVMNMTRCMITGEWHENAKSDIHHHPVTLYVVVKAVIQKNIQMNREFSSIDIIEEVMDLHFQMKIPFIVVLKSIHELYHSGNLLLPVELCQGDLNYFVKTYGSYMEEDDLSPILDKLKINWTNCGYTKNKYRWTDKN